MKIALLIGLIAIPAVFAACGRDSPSAPSGHAEAQRKVAGAASPPKVRVPTGPPPKDVVVKELRKGHGVMLKAGDWFSLNYVAVEYESGKRLEAHWERSGGFTWKFGTGEVVKGWETGLEGMRVGGRRELIVPSRLAYGGGALVYVVELLEVRRRQAISSQRLKPYFFASSFT